MKKISMMASIIRLFDCLMVTGMDYIGGDWIEQDNEKKATWTILEGIGSDAGNHHAGNRLRF